MNCHFCRLHTDETVEITGGAEFRRVQERAISNQHKTRLYISG